LDGPFRVSVLFNEPKLLKYAARALLRRALADRFSALQRAEIAEIGTVFLLDDLEEEFQCSSTSRNC